jgi:hypothetical protein
LARRAPSSRSSLGCVLRPIDLLSSLADLRPHGLIPQANSLIIRASQASGAIPESSAAAAAAADCLFHEDGLSLAFLRDVTGLSGCSTPTGSAAAVGGNEPDVLRISKDVGQLLRDVERELGNARALGTGRLKDGSEAYLRAIEVLIYRHVYHVGRTDIRVQAASLAVLESCSSAINIIRPTQCVLLLACSPRDGRKC